MNLAKNIREKDNSSNEEYMMNTETQFVIKPLKQVSMDRRGNNRSNSMQKYGAITGPRSIKVFHMIKLMQLFQNFTKKRYKINKKIQ